MPREGAAAALAERLNRAKARIDAAMGLRPTQRFRHGAGRGR